MAQWIGEALVLRATDFGESDRVVHLLTPDTGRLSAIAKGAKRSVRRFPGTLDLFNHLRVQIARGRAAALARLEHSTLLTCHPGLRAQPARFALACYVIELLDRLAPEGAVRADAAPVFEFARAALRAIESLTPDERLRVFIELRAFNALGMRPELRRCVRCGRELANESKRVAFHVSEGGPVCRPCRAGLEGLLEVHLGTLRALEQGLRFDLARLDRLALGATALAEARGLVARFQRFHLGIELRSERFLDEVLARPDVARTGS